MNAHRHFLNRMSLLAAMTLAWGCESGTGTEPVTVGTVTIAQVPAELAIGNTLQLSATVLSATGSTLPGHPVSWSSSHPAVATVSSGGLVEALSAGTTAIQASSGGKSGSVELTVVPGACTEATAGPVSVGQTRTGAFGPTDCHLYGGARAQGWSLDLSSATILEIGLTGDFYAGLVVTDMEMNEQAWGYSDSEGAELVEELAAGRYIIWALADLADGEERPYELSVAEGRYCETASVSATIGLDETHAGRLVAGDCLFLHLVRAQAHRLQVDEGTGVRIDLSSTDFDALLVVTDLEMEVLWSDDDSGGNLDSRIERRIPAGEYIVWATGYWPGSSGAYQLSVRGVEIELCPAVGTLDPGQTADGVLSTTDCVIEGQWYSDTWTMVLESTTTVQVDLTSDAFDTFLIVENEDGIGIAQDDDGGSGLNSRLVHTFGPGQYRVVATSYFPGETGAYQLSAQAASGSGTGVAGLLPADEALPWLKGRKP